MRLSQIRDFIAVVDAGSISSAALSLGVSQPGLTKSIGTLEAELNVSLLQRSPRGVSLTSYGRAFYSRAHAAHAELEKARQDVAQLAGARSGQVAVGFGPLAAALVVPAAAVQFQLRFPQVELRLLEGFAHAVIPLVRDQTLDMALAARFAGNRGDAALKFRPIFSNEQVVVGRKGHPLGASRSIQELAQVHWLSFEPRAVVIRQLSNLGLRTPVQVTQCESLNVLVAIMAGSDMLALASRRILTLPASGGALAELHRLERIPPMTTGLYVRADTPLTPAAGALARLMVDLGRQLPSA